MPNNKPQVMWAVRRPSGEWANILRPKRFIAVREIAGREDLWPQLYKQGWRIVKVEVRETKKGK